MKNSFKLLTLFAFLGMLIWSCSTQEESNTKDVENFILEKENSNIEILELEMLTEQQFLSTWNNLTKKEKAEAKKESELHTGNFSKVQSIECTQGVSGTTLTGIMNMGNGCYSYFAADIITGSISYGSCHDSLFFWLTGWCSVFEITTEKTRLPYCQHDSACETFQEHKDKTRQLPNPY